MLEEMVASVMKKTLAQDFPHLKLPAAVFATIDSAAKSDAFDIEELIVHNEVTGEVFKAHITSYWYEYKLTVIDRFGNPDANYPALPGIKSKKQFKAGAVVAVALPYSKKRKKAQKTQGFVTVSRTDMTGEAVKIPKGHVFKSILDINGEELRFFVLEAATLQKGASSVDVLVEAETEGSRYNVPAGQIVRTLTYLGDVTFSNAEDWIVREGSDTEDDESARVRTLRSWSELAQRATEDTFIDAAESVPGVLFAQADCNHPRGQGTVDVIVTGTAGEATEGLLAAVREAVDKIAGPYDNILVKSSVTVSQNISVTVTTDTADTDEAVENRVKAILTELLAVRRSRKLNELTLSDINHAIRSGYSGATNAAVSEPEADVKLGKDKVITLGDVSVTVERE